jgi:hypothetical protein
MSDEGRPIAWRALERGARVYSADGAQLGRLSHVIADDVKDIFSGIAFQKGILGDEVFAPAPAIDRITTDGIHLSLSSEEADAQLRPFRA